MKEIFRIQKRFSTDTNTFRFYIQHDYTLITKTPQYQDKESFKEVRKWHGWVKERVVVNVHIGDITKETHIGWQDFEITPHYSFGISVNVVFETEKEAIFFIENYHTESEDIYPDEKSSGKKCGKCKC